MAYKLKKYRGVHTIKDTKTGKSVDIDIEKYMTGGKKDKEGLAKKTDDNKDLTEKELEYIRESTGISFTKEGAESLFARPENIPVGTQPELDYGKYKDLGYFNMDYNGGQIIVSPTKQNPSNASLHKDNLTYLQKLNPNVNIIRNRSGNGYLPYEQRMEYGGKKVPKYAVGGCPEWDIECQERQKRLEGLTSRGEYGYQDGSIGNAAVPSQPLNIDYDYFNDPEDVMTGGTRQKVASVQAEGLQQGLSKGDDLLSNRYYDPKTKTYSDNTYETTTDASNLGPVALKADTSNINPQVDKNFNIFNQYAGVDIPTAAYTLGQGIKSGNAMDIVGSSLKLTTGLGRNIVGGMAQQNRYDQVMKEYYQDQKQDQYEYMAEGGRKAKELITGEYVTGVDENKEQGFNAEVEDGEYYKTNQGQVAEVVGKKHSQGGEKMNMEDEDRVLSDKLRLGGELSKQLSEKYDLKLKAKDTYSTVLDKYRKKVKLNKLVDREAELLEKIDEQRDVKDATTRDLNNKVLAEKMEELKEEKAPLEIQREQMFDELFQMQENSKTDDEKKPTMEFETGGEWKELAEKYGISEERAKELLEAARGAAKKDIERTQSKNVDGLFGNVTQEQYNDFVTRNSDWFDFTDFDPTKRGDVTRLQEQYNARTDGQTVKIDGLFGEQTASMFLTDTPPMQPIGFKNPDILAGDVPLRADQSAPQYEMTPNVEADIRNRNRGNGQMVGAYLFPDQSPMQPTQLQGTIKQETRYDRIRPNEIDIVPYLQSIADREAVQMRNLEGLSPNVRLAAMSNARANSQGQESQVRNQIDVQNLQQRAQADQFNARTQAREVDMNNQNALMYEQRQLTAQSNTDNQINDFYNQTQAISSQRFRDIQNLNIANARNEDMAYMPGRGFVQKRSNQELLNNYINSKGLNQYNAMYGFSIK